MDLHFSGQAVVFSLFKIYAAALHHIGDTALRRAGRVPDSRVGYPGYVKTALLFDFNLAYLLGDLLSGPADSDVRLSGTAVELAVIVDPAVVVDRVPGDGERL